MSIFYCNQQKDSQTLSQKAFLNAFASFMNYGVRIVISLIVTPILVAELGGVLFGVWQILTRMVGYMSAADARPSQALKWVIANYQNSDDVSIKKRIIGSALGTWLIMLPFLTLVGVGLVWVSPIVVKASAELAGLVRVTCFLLVINIVLSGIVTLPGSVLRGMNLGYKFMGLVAGMNVLGGFLIVGALYLDWGLIGIALANLLQTLITGVLFWRLVRIHLPWFGVTWASLHEIRQFFKLSIWYTAWNWVNKLLLSSDVMIIGIMLSAKDVTKYTLTGYVALTLTSIVTMMIGAAAPGLGGLISQRRYDKVVETRKEMLWMSCLISGVLGSMILLWNRSFVTLWVGGEHYAGSVVNLLLVLVAVQLLLLRIDNYLIDLTLKVKRKVLLGLLSALLSIGLALLLTHFFGIIGLCVGVLGGRLLLTIGYPAMTAEFLGVSLSAQFRSIYRPTLVMGVLFVLLTYIGQSVLAHNWIEMIICGSVSLLLVSLVFFWVGFSALQRRDLVNLMRRMKPSF